MAQGSEERRTERSYAGVPHASFEACAESMHAIVSRIAAIDIRDYETASLDRVRSGLVPASREALEDALALTAKVIAICDVGRDDATFGNVLASSQMVSFERVIEQAVEASDASLGSVEDIAFLVKLELRQRQERLDRSLELSSTASLLGECDSLLRRVRKGLAAIDVALAKLDQRPATLVFASELQESLAVRAAYARFRRRAACPTVDAADAKVSLHTLMRRAGTAIAVLVGWEAYPLLRVRDRLALRDLQRRILEWLRPECSGNELAGRRLWQDIVGFTELLVQVNRREELVEHDRRAVERLLRDASGLPEEALKRELAALFGLDEALDSIVRCTPMDVGALHAALARLGARVGVVSASE